MKNSKVLAVIAFLAGLQCAVNLNAVTINQKNSQKK
jgi:hypothetical protein